MLLKIMKHTLLLLCGVSLFAGCPTDGVDGRDGLNGQDGQNGLGYGLETTNAIFPVVDALSSASILRINPHTMAYVGEKTGTRYKLNKVDLDKPNERTVRDIGGNVAVITASVDGSRIALIQGAEIGYETFAGEYTKVYDADLNLLKTIPLSPLDAGGRIVEPLHHRDPSLAVTNKYVAVATEDDGFFSSGGAQQHISVYEIDSNKESHIKAFAGTAGGAKGAGISNIGTALMGIAMNGNFLLVGGSSGTAVYSINSDTLALTEVAAADTADGGCHWFKDNGSYVLESKTGTGLAGKVKVWKWNGASAPTKVGIVDVNGTGEGSIQALTFDPDNPAKAYFYCKLAAGTGNGGNVFSVMLNNSSLTQTPEFNFATVGWNVAVGRPAVNYPGTSPLTGLWTIEKQTKGSDAYYVFSGSYTGSYTPTGGSAVNFTAGTVLTVKNPTPGEIIEANSLKVTEERFEEPFNTAVRTIKTFKSTGGDVYFAAKNYSSGGTGVFNSAFKLVLEELD